MEIATWLPAATLLAIIISDIVDREQLPQHLQEKLDAICSPFRNFLTIHDLDDVSGQPIRSRPWKARALAVLAVAQAIGWLAATLYAASSEDNHLVVQCAISVLVWTYSAMRVLAKPPKTPPYFLMVLYLSQAIPSFVALVTEVFGAVDTGHVVVLALRLGLVIATIWLAGTFPLQYIPPATNIGEPGSLPNISQSCPEDAVNLWQWSTFSYIEGLFTVAMRGTLQDTDVFALSPYFRHRNLFRKYLSYTAAHPEHSLLWFLLASNSLDLILDIVLELWNATAGFVPPYALQQILTALADPTPANKMRAYAWSLVTFLVHLSFAQVDLFQAWHTRRSYERTRGQLFCALHYKALKRRDIGKTTSKDAKSKDVAEKDNEESADLGKIVNLMQGDAYAVAQRFWEFSGLFTSPVRLIIALVFLYRILGWSALFGVAVVLVAYVLNYPLAKYNIHITRSSWRAKDQRMSIVNELFQNIRFLKFYGWENHWGSKALGARETELRWRVRANVVDVVTTFIWTWMPSATALSVFLCYTLIAGEKLTVAKAFTSISLFSYLQEPMTAIPGQVFAMLHAYVSMQRIQAFLREPEIPEWASSLNTTPSAPSLNSAPPDVGFDVASFEWDAAPRSVDGTSTPSARFTLGPLDITFPAGKLTLVTGATGAGKSALLAALLGEMHCVAGRVRIKKAGHEVAYCGQTPWLEHATIRNNIIFGSRYGFDEERYNAVIEACALARDLEIFEAGDQTEIGEKGITLSGGQRARIALARAYYSEAKVILLDDPLAAVDMHTAEHIKNGFTSPLNDGRTIILVTHHISLCLPIASYIVELSRGRVLRRGYVEDLQRAGELQEVIEKEDEPLNEKADLEDVEENEVDALKGPAHLAAKDKKDGTLVKAEARAEGRVSMHTYVTYIKAAGVYTWVGSLCLLILIRVINIMSQVFLAKWGEAYDHPAQTYLVTFTRVITKMQYPWEKLPPPEVNVRPWLMVYLWISVAGAFSVLASLSLRYYASLQASRSLFNAMLRRLVKAPARFFDVTPLGRILNRFTSDINTIDGALGASSQAMLSGTLNFLFSFSVILIIVPAFSPFALFIAWLYIRLSIPFINASRDLRRLESISLSPAFAGFDELLRGLTVLRAFGMEQRYQERFYERVDKFQNFDHIYWLVNGWLRWRYDCLGSVIVFLATLFALWSNVSNGFAALVIVQAGVFADASRQLVRVAAQLELDFNSVERVVEYLDVSQEAPSILPDRRPPAYWPSSEGGIDVQGLVVRYSPDLAPALQNVSFSVKPAEKIGIVGRTGSGKSTLALSLLRMVEPDGGKIIIDGIDISSIGLEDLRTRVTIVSQDVTLFQDTLRRNIDPFDEHTDAECWDVLERCHLPSLLRSSNPDEETEVSLDMPISQTGSLSAGERQLLALARAILRGTNVIILDEATSQIDSHLDDMIQKTIRSELGFATVVTIAHRLKTISDYDRILVLDAGKVVEFDSPRKLFRDRKSVFSTMCRRSADWQTLESMIEG